MGLASFKEQEIAFFYLVTGPVDQVLQFSLEAINNFVTGMDDLAFAATGAGRETNEEGFYFLPVWCKYSIYN